MFANMSGGHCFTSRKHHPYTDDGHCKIVETFVLKCFMTSEKYNTFESSQCLIYLQKKVKATMHEGDC